MDPSLDDQSLRSDLVAARRGDRAALDRVLNQVQERLRRLAQGRMGPGLRARVRTSDVLQSTFLDVMRSIDQFTGKDEDAFVAWVGRILENNIRDKGKYFQARKRREPDSVGFSEDGAGMRLATASPSTQAVRAEDLLLVTRAMESLDEDYRKVILLRMVEGRSHREIGDALGRSEAATRMLLSRARSALSLELDRLRSAP